MTDDAGKIEKPKARKKRVLPKPGRKATFEESQRETLKRFAKTFERLAREGD